MKRTVKIEETACGTCKLLEPGWCPHGHVKGEKVALYVPVEEAGSKCREKMTKL